MLLVRFVLFDLLMASANEFSPDVVMLFPLIWIMWLPAISIPCVLDEDAIILLPVIFV